MVQPVRENAIEQIKQSGGTWTAASFAGVYVKVLEEYAVNTSLIIDQLCESEQIDEKDWVYTGDAFWVTNEEVALLFKLSINY